MTDPADLFGPDPRLPEGLAYANRLVSAAEEMRLVERLAELPFKPFEFQGFVGKRRIVSFGWAYRFDGTGLVAAEPMPDWLLDARRLAAGFAGLESDRLEHALLIEYAPGAGLGWHRDRPVFGDVIGLSLLSPAPLRFRRQRPSGGWDRFRIEAEPRSAYLLRGPARDLWEHSLPPVTALRYSITFRTLRREVRP